MRIHPHTSGLQLLGHPDCPFEVGTPHRRTQAHLGVVRPFNHVVLVAPFQGWKNGAKGLFGHDARRLRWVVNDGRGDEVAFAGAWIGVGIGKGAADSWLPAFFADVGKERLDLFILHAVLNGPEEDVGFETGTDFERLRMLDHGGEEFVID